MEDLKIIEYKKMDLSNSMLIVAFPTVGLVSSIAGRYIIDSLGLEQIGEISSRFFIPATVIHKGVPRPPVRIYAGKKVCGEDGSCDQIVVIISEFMPPLELIKPLSTIIMEWSEKKGCKIIVTFEGLHTSNTKKTSIYGVSTTPRTRKILERFKIEEIQEGMITGDSGVFLYEGARLQKDVICLLADAHASYPDSRAAGMLLEVLDKLLPGIKIDPEPLYKEADEIEKRIRRFLDQTKPTAPSIPHMTSTMYG
ncbi:MAG: PAC2 family protein [Candidatus Thermoplasmatota archaeon]